MKQKKQIRLLDRLVQNAVGKTKRIVLPETTDKRVLEAAALCAENYIGKIILLGNEKQYQNVFSKRAQKNILFIDNKNPELIEKYAVELAKLREKKGVTKEIAKNLLQDKNYFGTMMVKMGDADGMVSGATCKTEEVLRPAFQIIKTQKGQLIASSCFIMQCPEGSTYGKDGVLVLGDCGVNINPSAEELCDIAIQTASTTKKLCGFEPYVAMLSYSTKSESEKISAEIQKVKDAFLLVRRKDSSICIDGELQVDAALDKSVAKLKCPHSDVAGKANVLIFPNIDAGNIAYKLAQRISGADCIGPIVQGLAKPINDVSRGATAEEIMVNVAITILMC